jgi:hypothetical protein
MKQSNGTFHYSIVRFVPDPLREEAINLGVMLVSADGKYADYQFLHRYKTRIASMAPDFDQQLVEAVYSDLADALQGRGWQPELAHLGRTISGEWLDELSNRFMNQIQFSSPRACIPSDPDETLQQLFRRFVRGGRRIMPPTQIIDRIEIRHRCETLLRDWVRQPSRVARPVIVKGATASHSFDLGLKNGVVTAALHALSFQVPSTLDTVLHRDHIAAAAYDIHRSRSDFPVYAVFAPQRHDTDGLLEESRQMLMEQSVNFVLLDELPERRDEIVRTLFSLDQ